MLVKTLVPTMISRRRLLPGSAGASSVAVLGLPERDANAAKALVVGFTYIGPKDDYGDNQAHAEATAVPKKIAGVKIVEERPNPGHA